MALSRKANEDPVQTHCKREILGAFWSQNTSPVLAVRESRDRCPWNAYFQHYTVECRKTIEPDGGKHATVRQHQDIIPIIRQLEEAHTKETIKLSLAALVTQQRSEADKQHMAEGSIRLAVRLFLMVDVGAPSRYRTWGPSFLPWSDEQTMKAVLTNHFVISSTESKDVVFEEEFTAFNLQRFTGLEIQWTNNLADHLRLIDNDKRLYIFHHATFLQYQTRHVPKHHPAYFTNC